MNILLIGNGFDLAHNLPTQYKHFLKWINEYKETRDSRGVLREEKINPYFKDLLDKDFKHSIREELDIITEDNMWIDYFTNCRTYVKENWIDFENEISRIIKFLDEDMIKENGNRCELFETVDKLSNTFLQEKFSEYLFTNRSFVALSGDDKVKKMTFGQLRDKLYSDMREYMI